jgi:hypothetical protein
MVKLSERALVGATLGQTQRLLQVPDLHPLERLGLERQHAALASELEQLRVPGNHAQTLLVFEGRPVVASTGVEARFAADVLAEYQKLVSKLAAVHLRGELRGGGRLPDEKLSRFHITNVVHGSFGFELEELSPEEPERTPLAAAVDDATRLIHSAGESDESFEDVFAEVAPPEGTQEGSERIRRSLEDFLKAISDAGAELKLETPTLAARLDSVRLAAAVERVSTTEVTVEPEVAVPGTFLGILLESGRFEHRANTGEVLSGRTVRDVDWTQIAACSNQASVAYVKVETFQRRSKARRRYTLLRIEPARTG